MVTCIDVAKKAGVSRQTVSRVINHSPNVAKETRQKVLDAIRELSYYPNTVARSLKAAKSLSVGFIIADPSNPFYIKIASILQSKLSKLNYSLLLLFANENELEESKCFTQLFEKRVELILFTPSGTSPHIEEVIEKHQTPVIQLFRDLYPGFSSVMIDDKLGTYLAACRLLSAGHRRLLLVEGSYEFQTERILGFKQALAEYGVPFREEMHLCLPNDGDHSVKRFEEHFERFSPTAIIPVSKNIETLVLSALDRTHRKIRDDVSLVFYDDNEVAELLKITVVSHDMDEIAAIIADSIFECLRAPETRLHKTLSPRLLERDSVKALLS